MTTQYYGCAIETAKGRFTIAYRNSSNGYYGGWLTWPTDGFYGREGREMPKVKNLYVINGDIVLYAENSRGVPLCVAKGCYSKKVTSTLIGLNFCDKHYSAFFSSEPMEYEDWRTCSNSHKWQAQD